MKISLVLSQTNTVTAHFMEGVYTFYVCSVNF